MICNGKYTILLCVKTTGDFRMNKDMKAVTSVVKLLDHVFIFSIVSFTFSRAERHMRLSRSLKDYYIHRNLYAPIT